jgi:hypothetical protein
MRPRPWRLAVAAASVIALAVAGCGGGDGDPAEESDSGYQSPLAEFFGWDDAARVDEPEFTEEDRQNHHEVEALVAECMNEAGFEYTPMPFWGDQQENFEDPHADIWQLQQDDPEEFARQYGYGMTTIDYEEVPESEVPEDPNVAYRESLSPNAQQEYDETLYGEEAVRTVEPGEDGEAEPVEPSGCYNDAYVQVYGDRTEEEGQFQSLHEEWGTLEERITNDPRMTEATQAWIGCMADAGYPDLETLYSGQDEVSERQGELYSWDEGGAVPLPVPEGEAEGEGEGDAGQTPSPPPEPDPAAVEELRQFELEIAMADYTCKQEHGVEDVEHTVRDEHEQRFIDEHREQLEAYRDWLNEQGGVG